MVNCKWQPSIILLNTASLEVVYIREDNSALIWVRCCFNMPLIHQENITIAKNTQAISTRGKATFHVQHMVQLIDGTQSSPRTHLLLIC